MKTTVNKKIWMGMLVLVFGMLVVGCWSSPSTKAPSSFRSGSGSAGDTTILLRQGLAFDQAFREAIFVLSRHGFEPEMMNNDAGYIRTRWNNRWNERGAEIDWYRVRVVINFNPTRTQMIVSAPSEWLNDGQWIGGYDTRAIETLRTDLTQSIGN